MVCFNRILIAIFFSSCAFNIIFLWMVVIKYAFQWNGFTNYFDDEFFFLYFVFIYIFLFSKFAHGNLHNIIKTSIFPLDLTLILQISILRYSEYIYALNVFLFVCTEQSNLYCISNERQQNQNNRIFKWYANELSQFNWFR